MSTRSVQNASNPAPWAEVLARVEAVLTCAAAEAAQREQVFLASLPSAERGRPEWDWAKLEQGLQHLSACVTRAERASDAAEGALRTEEEKLRAWLGDVRASAERLAKGTGRPI